MSAVEIAGVSRDPGTVSAGEGLDVHARRLLADLHAPRAAVFWGDLLLCATVGWAAFAVALIAEPLPVRVAAGIVSALALYRALCFTHEINHLRRGAIPGFETVWNLLFGVPLLLPSFTYLGHQAHHNLSTYGTLGDPEYLPFARTRGLMVKFLLQSLFVLPVLVGLRFLVLAPVGLVWPRFHRWLELHASAFAMNPAYRPVVTASDAAKIRRWEAATFAVWAGIIGSMIFGVLSVQFLLVWYLVMAFATLLNTLRVMGAHGYESDGTPRSRFEQLADSIDTPGGFWTELWAPVGLRYHALHHFFPGVPYHNLGTAYRRLMRQLPSESKAQYCQSMSTSLGRSLARLHHKAAQATDGPLRQP